MPDHGVECADGRDISGEITIDFTEDAGWGRRMKYEIGALRQDGDVRQDWLEGRQPVRSIWFHTSAQRATAREGDQSQSTASHPGFPRVGTGRDLLRWGAGLERAFFLDLFHDARRAPGQGSLFEDEATRDACRRI